MTQSTKLGYMPCKYRNNTSFTNKKGQLISYGKCVKDGKSCRTWDMEGYCCYEIREEDAV